MGGILEFLALSLFTVASYGVIVVGLGSLAGTGGRPNVLLAVVATAVVAIALPPVRARARRLSARIAYGSSGEPYQVLLGVARAVSAARSAEDVLPRMAEVVARGTGALTARVWLRVGDELRPAATWPRDVPGRVSSIPLPAVGAPRFPEATHAVPVLDGSRILGALSLHLPEGQALTEIEESLLDGLVSHAGLALRNVALTAELRERLETIERQAHDLEASRRRILGAEADERRRLERAIHDGVQQHLVSVAVKLRLALQRAAERPELAHRLLVEIGNELDRALNSLRDLARGIHPPILSDRGVAAALDSHRTQLPFQVLLDDRTDGRRFEREVEAAVYFCCVEALRSATGRASITLEQEDGHLMFTVAHDGAMDPTALRHVEDRVAGFDGDFTAGGGRAVGRIPIVTPAGHA